MEDHFDAGWVFRDARQNWHRLELDNASLVRIGRFANDSTEQAVFAGPCEGGTGCPFVILSLDATTNLARTMTDGY